MASKHQIEANRKNALRSQGPSTKKGKLRSSRNSLRHGLTAEFHYLIDGEDENEFEAFHDSIVEELQPESAIECEYVRSIISIAWRLRRIPIFEASLVARIEEHTREKENHDRKFGAFHRMSRSIEFGRHPPPVLDMSLKLY